MTPKVIFIRHAQAEHNIDARHHIPDPVLSEEGRGQCIQLRDHLREHYPAVEQAALVVSSPLRRCLETTHLSLDWLIERGVPVTARADWQENAEVPCDTGSEVAEVSQEYPGVDFSSIDDIFPKKIGPYAYTLQAIKARGVRAKQWLRERPEQVIIVVTHSAFLRTAVAFRRFANADYRVFTFAEDPDDLELVEEDIGTEGHGGMGRSREGRVMEEEGELRDGDQELDCR